MMSIEILSIVSVQIETTKLEEGIQSNTDETILFYNKGL